MKVTCNLPNASHEINGIKFVPLASGEGVVAANVTPDEAAMFAGIPGYEVGESDALASDRKPPSKKQYGEAVESAAHAIIEGMPGAESPAAAAKMMVGDGFFADEADLAADIGKRVNELKEEAGTRAAADAAAAKAKKDADDKAAQGASGAQGQTSGASGSAGPAAAPDGEGKKDEVKTPATGSTGGVQF